MTVSIDASMKLCIEITVKDEQAKMLLSQQISSALIQTSPPANKIRICTKFAYLISWLIVHLNSY